MAKQIQQVKFYQGVQMNSGTVTYIAIDTKLTDKTLLRGYEAEELATGVRVFNMRTEEDYLIPYNNIAYIKYVAEAQSATSLKKAK